MEELCHWGGLALRFQQTWPFPAFTCCFLPADHDESSQLFMPWCLCYVTVDSDLLKPYDTVNAFFKSCHGHSKRKKKKKTKTIPKRIRD